MYKINQALLALGAGVSIFVLATVPARGANDAGMNQPVTPEQHALLAELRKYPYRIVHETYRNNCWVLVTVDADGSNQAVLTRTPGANEMYPHVSPDGKKIVFECDEGEGEAQRRNIYLMNMDGSGRARIAEAGRDACWTPDGKRIVYLKDEVNPLERMDFATKGMFIYDLATAETRQHVNHSLHHLYNFCCTTDGKWYISTVHAGMGVKHGILAIEANGKKVFNLDIPGCRPDVSRDGRHIAWGADDNTLRAGELDFSGPKPRVINQHDIMHVEDHMETYHVDWSPDGKYIAFSRGGTTGSLGGAPEIVGNRAKGWNICVADAGKTNCWVSITTDGNSNKEPDWFEVVK